MTFRYLAIFRFHIDSEHMARARFNGKVYKPVRFNETPELGTVDDELARRRARKRERAEDAQWAKLMAQQAKERETPWTKFCLFIRRLMNSEK